MYLNVCFNLALINVKYFGKQILLQYKHLKQCCTRANLNRAIEIFDGITEIRLNKNKKLTILCCTKNLMYSRMPHEIILDV